MNSIINADFNGFGVVFNSDAYINATAIAKQFGKFPKDFLKTEQTQEYIAALDRRKILSTENQWVIVKKGNFSNTPQGTWLHPKLAIFFARWLSADFAVWCDEQIERILGVNLGGRTTTTDERTGLRDAVNAVVSKKGLLYPDAYKLVHQRFNVEHIDELTLEQVGEATEYLHRLLLNDNGERPVNLEPLIMCALTCDSAWETLKPILYKVNPEMTSSMHSFFASLRATARTTARSIGFTASEVHQPWLQYEMKNHIVTIPMAQTAEYLVRLNCGIPELAQVAFKPA